MPRADIAAVEAWRAEFRAQKRFEAASAERLIQGWSTLVLVLTLLYLFIGPNPYQHGVELNAETGGAQLSPVNRYAWMLLGAMSTPLLWLRRAQLRSAAVTLWVLLALYVWFFMTTLWALDPASSNRRLFLYIINLLIAVALGLGFGGARKFHHALAVGCAVMVFIDLMSWLVMPGVSMTELGLAAIHGQKNQLGLVMMVSAMVVGPLCLTPPNPRLRWFWIGVFLASVAMLVASQSKTSLSILFATMLLAPVLLFILRLSERAIQAIWSVMVLIPFAGLLGWLAWCTVTGLNPMAPIQGLTFTQRTDVWAFVFSEIIKHPIGGEGFGSFWDINPLLQPSLNADLWFGSPDLANQAHNGYLDLFVTTGIVGLLGALFLLFRWIARGMGLIRNLALSKGSGNHLDDSAALVFGLFPMLIFVHNFMESSYFTANSILGPLLLMIGVELDLAYARRRGSR